MSKGNQASTRGPAPVRSVNQDAVAKRAYELFLQRGSVPGHEVDDWLQAEVELAARAEHDEAGTTRSAGAADDDRAATDVEGSSGTEPTRRPATRERGGNS